MNLKPHSNSFETELALADDVGDHHLNPMIKAFLAGCFSGTCSTLLLQPFDLLKTRLQTNRPTVGSSSICSKRVSLAALFMQVVRDEKVTALWRGTVPSLVRCVPGVGIYFCCVHTFQNQFCPGRRPNVGEAALFGLVARCIAGALLLPATVVKTRLESGLFAYRGVGHALGCIYRTEGLRGLFSGLSATLLRDAPFSALHLAIYTQLRQKLQYRQEQSSNKIQSGQNAALETFACSLVAALSASMLTQPADVIKTRMQTRAGSGGSLNTAMQVYRDDGPLGLWRGLAPRLMRRALMSALAWTIFETIISKAGLKS